MAEPDDLDRTIAAELSGYLMAKSVKADKEDLPKYEKAVGLFRRVANGEEAAPWSTG